MLAFNFWLPYIRGILVSAAAALVLLLFNNGYRITYSEGNLYFFCLFFFGVIPLLFAQGAYIFFDFILKYQPLQNKEIKYMTYLCGYFSALSLFIYLIRNSMAEYYILFYNPVIYISMTVIISLLSLKILDRGADVFTYILYGLTLLFSFLISLIPYLYFTNHFFYAFLITFVLTGLGAVFFLFLRQKPRNRNRLVPLI